MYYSILDATLLKIDATEKEIIDFIECAIKKQVAAICIYPLHLKYLEPYSHLANRPKFCTVINFPSGKEPKSQILYELYTLKSDLVDEIDVVWNYSEWGSCSNGYNPQKAVQPIYTVLEWVMSIKKDIIIKIILETGYLEYFKPEDHSNLKNAIDYILREFGDYIHFLKTSTGKSEYGGASLKAVKTMVDCIRDFHLDHSIGIKVSGGINSEEILYNYLFLLDSLKWNGPVRIGSSKLIQN
jgi:deoxyribose-phosphate aldolase